MYVYIVIGDRCWYLGNRDRVEEELAKEGKVLSVDNYVYPRWVMLQARQAHPAGKARTIRA